MKLSFENFRGSWAGLPVAWDAQDRFDEKTYRRDIARCCRLGVPGVYTGGTTGEFYAMELDEYWKVARATVEETHAGGKPAMIGVSSTYTRGAVRRAEFAAEIGADAVQVALPFWMEVPDEAVLNFFTEVSKAAGHKPFSIYETRRTRKALTLDQHQAIKEALPNYLMVKANADTIGTTVAGCSELAKLGINVFGDEGSLWPQLGPHGMTGCCSSFVYYVPELVLPLNQDLKDKNWGELSCRASKINRILDFVTATFDPKGYLDSAGDRLGGVAGGVLRTSLYCRGPYPHANEEDVRHFRTWYRENLPEVYENIEARLSEE